MDFNLSDDQAMLRDTAERLFSDGADDLWAAMAELGLVAAPFDEAHGGLGLGAVETMIIGEAAGRAQSACGYGDAIARAGTALRLASHRPDGLIDQVAVGEARLAWAEDGQMARSGDGVSGSFRNVAFADRADWLVLAQPDLVVLVAAANVTRGDYVLFDETPASDLTLEGVAAMVLAEGEAAADLVERVRQHGVAWRATEAVGLMQAVLDATVEHLKTRRQFGKTLSEFQALRHKAAEMLVSLEQARSMAMFAALSVEDADAVSRREALAQVRRVVSRAARHVAQTSVQLHGGIGVTEEHPVGRAFRRLTMIDLELDHG